MPRPGERCRYHAQERALELPNNTTSGIQADKSSRALLFAAKIAVVAYAIYLCAYGTWLYIPIHRAIVAISILALLPLCGWGLPTTVAGVLFALGPYRLKHWYPVDDFGNIIFFGLCAFLTGCALDHKNGYGNHFIGLTFLGGFVVVHRIAYSIAYSL